MTSAAAVTAVASVSPAVILAAGPAGPGRNLLALQPFPASERPFDAGGRSELAKDLLTFFVKQKGLFPGRGVYLLPAAPWVGGWEPVSPRMAWDFTIPAGQPLYLLAAADVTGKQDAAQLASATSVSVNGTPLTDLAGYAHGGVGALHSGETKNHTILDLVFAPPAPGRYKVEVKTRVAQGAVSAARAEGNDQNAGNDGDAPIPAAQPTFQDVSLLYDITIQPSDALGSLLLRDPSGRVYATHGRDRRQVPDPETLQALGYPDWAVLGVSETLLQYLPEGAPLPSLRNGMLVRADNHQAVFRLDGGKRAWQSGLSVSTSGGLSPVVAGASDDPAAVAPVVRTVEAAVLGAIAPVLQSDMLLKGNASDVFHVEKGALRKIPDWKWATDRKLNVSDTLFVPDRIMASLPQNSPHWIIPGGTFEDRTFGSEALGRQMPYRVFLPPDYHAAERSGNRYPVLYLLHGMGGRYDEWSGYGVEEVANQLFKDGKLVHTIIVAPQGGLGYWMNQDGGTPWADYMARDLVRHVDGAFRTIARREARAVGGLSMGAHGALQLALNFPETFGIAGAHSPSIRTAEHAPAYFGRGSAFARRDPISLVKESGLQTPPRIWMDSGKDDSWRPMAEELHKVLQAKGWAHEWHVYAGDHDGWYWGDHIWEYLPYYSSAFQANGLQLYR